MSGPYVIVNRYTEQAWSAAGGETRDADRIVQFPARAQAALFVLVERLQQDMDDDECAIMPLAQYIVEYGE